MSMDFSKEIEANKDAVMNKHTCLVYHTSEEWRRTVIPYLAAGLAKQEKCLYITDSNTISEITAYLEEEGVNTWALQKDIVFFAVRDVFLFENEFDPYQATLFLMEQARQANREGYMSLRFSCEMSGVLPYMPNPELIIKYEALVNRFILRKYNCSALCQYQAQKFTPHLLEEVQASHPKGMNKHQRKSNRLDVRRLK